MDRDNYFILLELSFDPIENNTSKITAAIEQKRQQWGRDMRFAMKKVKAGKYLAMLDDIKSVMLDPTLRAKEAAQAKQIRDEWTQELDKKIKVSSAKGYVKPTEISQWHTAFAAVGITEEFIKKRIRVPISTTAPANSGDREPKQEVIDQNTAKNIDVQFKSLGLKNYDLYKFLNMPQSSSAAALHNEADRNRKLMIAKGDKAPEDMAKQALYGICCVQFKDAASKAKYDNYLNATRYGDINSFIDEAAVQNKRSISAPVYETLLDIAVKQYRLGVAEAGTYIKRYCKFKGYAIEGGSKVICGLCKTENPAGAKTCSGCGKALFIVCPKCKEENGNAAKTCAGCGFDLSRMNEALPLIERARKAMYAKDWSTARQLLNEAGLRWPNHPDLAQLGAELDKKADELKRAEQQINQDIADKNMYAARLKINRAKADGLKIDAQLESKVNSTIKAVEEGVARARNVSKEEAFLIISKLACEINDSSDVNSMKDGFLPEAVSSVRLSIRNAAAELDWTKTKSVGDCKYVLVRKMDAYPNTVKDGELIYRGTDVHYTDSTLLSGKEYYYALFTERLGVYSEPARAADAAVIVSGVTQLRAVGGDGLVTLSWNKANTVTEIRLWQYKGNEQPQNTGCCERLVCNRLDGIVVGGLDNGVRYWFAVQALHRINGHIVEAETVFINAVAQRPAAPLEDFNIAKNKESYSASWAQSEWDVLLLKSNTKPDFTVGTIYNLEEMLAKYEKIDMSLKSMTEAEFRLSFVGECYIIPCVVNASNVIMNTAYYLSSVDDVTRVSCDVNAAGTEMYVNFKWPKGIRKVLMLYRTDTYPEGADDANANRIECTKKQYEANDALLIMNPGTGTYYAMIYAVFESESKSVYSNGVRFMADNEPQRELFYTLKLKKGFFSSKRSLNLSVFSENEFSMPPFVLVMKQGGMPLSKEDGTVIGSVREEDEPKLIHDYSFDAGNLPKDDFVKLFFVNKSQYKRFKLQRL